MPLFNSPARYGAATKVFHWATVALFSFQLLSALVMTRLGDDGAAAGLGRDSWYNWHKTLGLVALLVAILRLAARRAGTLPSWAPTLTETEKRIVHRAEQALYLAMFAMPVSGFVFVMAGGYGVQFAGMIAMPNPIGRWESLGEGARILHIAGAILLGIALATHMTIVVRHVVFLRDGLLRRILPQR